MSVKKKGIAAKQAAAFLRTTTTLQKKRALEAIAHELELRREDILFANEKDLSQKGLSEAMRDRLNLQGRLADVIADLRQVIALPDPVGEVLEERLLPTGLHLLKKRVPIGVIGIIYEARPNVTIDVTSLCLKTGNSAILRGGKETEQTNKALLKAIHAGLKRAGFPKECIQMLSPSSRRQVKQLLHLDAYVDIIIPRGGALLQEFCKKESRIPVISGGVGICHLYVDKHVDQKRALDVIKNAKMQRPSVCNALDTLLVHQKIAPTFLPKLGAHLQGVHFRLHPNAIAYLTGITAKDEDWHTEWLDLILGIKIVDSLEEAIEHIQTYSSGHSDGILTDDSPTAEQFVREIDSAAVYVNASTRFTDGAQFGLGAEIAVSTQKLHARGPVGLKELTTYKWILTGDYLSR